MGEVLRVAMRVVQATAGKLSQPMAVWLPRMLVPMAASRTDSWRSTPAISRSKLVIVPCGFESETT
jgi:hypothetical protein